MHPINMYVKEIRLDKAYSLRICKCSEKFFIIYFVMFQILLYTVAVVLVLSPERNFFHTSQILKQAGNNLNYFQLNLEHQLAFSQQNNILFVLQ